MKQLSGTVVAARDERLRDETGRIRPPRLNELLNRSLLRLAGVKKIEDFWPLLLKSDDVVAIKVNCLAGRRLSTTVELVEALVRSLARGGIPPRNVIVWDRTGRELKKAGFPLRTSGSSWRCYGTDAVGYESEVTFSGEVGSCLSKILTRRADVLINVGVIKDHDLAGVSIGMKNLFGIIHNPNKYHDNVCDPYVADVSNFPVVRRKLRLIIADGTLAQCHNGPAWSPAYAWKYNGILVGTDPVAVDRVGCEIIERKRRALSLPDLKRAKRWPVWLRTAEKLGLGTADWKKIRLLEEADGL